MKEKNTTKIVRVDDEIVIVLSDRNSVHNSLQNSTNSHENSAYPLVIAGKHNIEFIDMKDEKDDEVTFKVRDTPLSIKMEDTKPLTNVRPSSGVMFDVPDRSANMYISQPDLSFQSVKPQVKEERNYASSTKCFASYTNAQERLSGETEDKDPKSISNTGRSIMKGSPIEESPRSFLWQDSSSSEKKFPTYLLDNKTGLSSGFFDKPGNLVRVKEEKTGSFDVKPVLHETSTSALEFDCHQSVLSGFSESSKMSTVEKTDSPFELPAPKQFVPDSDDSEVQILERTKLLLKEETKEAASALDRSAVLQATRRKKREVDLLYDNLKEISWAQDKSFTNLLDDEEIHTRLERVSTAKGGSPTSRRKPINISIGEKIIKKMSAQRRNCPPKSKEVRKVKIKQEIQGGHSKYFGKSKLGSKQKIKWYKPSSKDLKNKNINLVQNKKKFGKLQPKLSNKVKSAELKKHIIAGEESKLSNDSKPAAKQTSNSSSSSKKNQNSKAVKQDEKKKKDLLSKNGAVCSKKEPAETKDTTEENGSGISESLQRGPELRVTIEPLENPDIWTSEIFKKKNFHQAAFKAFSGMNQGNVESVLRGVNDSIISRNNVKTAKKKKYEEESIRTSVRQSECAFRYKEIVVKKHQDYMQVVLVPNSQKQNCLSIEAMKELREAFFSAKKDSNCKAVLLNSSGSFFCSGVDLSQLLGPNKKQVAEEMAVTLKELIQTIAFFHKPVVAAVNGHTSGLGVALLTFCDIVLASDKATFCIPAATLGYLPEGGVVLTLPQVVGATVAVEMLLQGRRLTAEQALKYGLVSEVLWPTQLMENVVPRIQALVSQSSQVMSATKTMVRCYLWEKLSLQLSQECPIISTQWQQPTCQQNIKKMLAALQNE